MRTETIEIFTFDELKDEKSKERARDWWRVISSHDLAWADESRESIQTFCEFFGVSLLDWSVGPYAPYHYKTNAENKHFRGLRLKDVNRDYMPTGYCLDCSLWMTFFDSFKSTGDAKEAFNVALNQAFIDWREDMESQMEDEFIDDTLISNSYEFTADGRHYV